MFPVSTAGARARWTNFSSRLIPLGDKTIRQEQQRTWKINQELLVKRRNLVYVWCVAQKFGKLARSLARMCVGLIFRVVFLVLCAIFSVYFSTNGSMPVVLMNFWMRNVQWGLSGSVLTSWLSASKAFPDALVHVSASLGSLEERRRTPPRFVPSNASCVTQFSNLVEGQTAREAKKLFVQNSRLALASFYRLTSSALSSSRTQLTFSPLYHKKKSLLTSWTSWMDSRWASKRVARGGVRWTDSRSSAPWGAVTGRKPLRSWDYLHVQDLQLGTTLVA